MISDNDTNTIYFSELLKTDSRFSAIYNNIKSILDSFGLNCALLPDTRDIWARDYMPIQVSDKRYIEYRYDPDYLQGKKYRYLKSYPDIICDSLGKKTKKTDLVIDGGNVVKSSKCVILTDKVVEENKPFYNREKILGKLRDLFELDKVVIIPWDKDAEIYGHADGMLRFIDDDKVLIQGYYDQYDADFQRKLFGELDRKGIEPVPLIFNVKKANKNNWAYLNFLQTKDLILLPALKGASENEQALNQMEKHYPRYIGRIIPIEMDAIIAEGGALNCISWTTKE